MSAWAGWPEKSAWTGQTGQTERTGCPAHDSKDMTARHPGQASWERTVRIGKLGDKRAGKGRWDMTCGTCQLERTVGTGQRWQDSHGR
jgi:hypothetical protein